MKTRSSHQAPRRLAVDWQETSWLPQWNRRPIRANAREVPGIGALRMAFVAPSVRRPAAYPERRTLSLRYGQWRAFTLVEMLTVIAVIALLAGILVPVLGRARTKAQVAKARTEMALLINAIKNYETEYSQMPTSPEAKTAAAAKMANPATAKQADYTFGYTGNRPNSDIMAILLDRSFGPNVNSKKNPRHIVGLNVKETRSLNAAGVNSDDLVYRDPWGNPYIITLDMNADERCYDAYYGDLGGHAVVWSWGPDGDYDRAGFDPNLPTKGANKDNVLSWK